MITTEPRPLGASAFRHNRMTSSFGGMLHAVEKLGTGDEGDAEAGRGEHPPGIARIALQIVGSALDRADGDGVGDKIRLKARLDDKQATDLLQHRHWLSKRHANGVVPPFPD